MTGRREPKTRRAWTTAETILAGAAIALVTEVVISSDWTVLAAAAMALWRILSGAYPVDELGDE